MFLCPTQLYPTVSYIVHKSPKRPHLEKRTFGHAPSTCRQCVPTFICNRNARSQLDGRLMSLWLDYDLDAI